MKDQGRGIGKADLPRVFDPYFSTKRLGAEKGTGIGLAVCHSGYADDPVIANCRDFGFDASLIKPFSLKTLRSLIEDLVQDRGA